MITLKITAVKGADNETTLSVVDSDGLPFDLDAEGATEVRIRICDRLVTVELRNVAFSGSVITVVFGDLGIAPGNYLPKILYFSPGKPDGEILAAPCFETQIKLKMVC